MGYYDHGVMQALRLGRWADPEAEGRYRRAEQGRAGTRRQSALFLLAGWFF